MLLILIPAVLIVLSAIMIFVLRKCKHKWITGIFKWTLSLSIAIIIGSGAVHASDAHDYKYSISDYNNISLRLEDANEFHTQMSEDKISKLRIDVCDINEYIKYQRSLRDNILINWISCKYDIADLDYLSLDIIGNTPELKQIYGEFD